MNDFEKLGSENLRLKADLRQVEARVKELEAERRQLESGGSAYIEYHADGKTVLRYNAEVFTALPFTGRMPKVGEPMNPPATDPHCEGCAKDDCEDRRSVDKFDAIDSAYGDGIHWRCYEAPKVTAPEHTPISEYGDMTDVDAAHVAANRGEWWNVSKLSLNALDALTARIEALERDAIDFENIKCAECSTINCRFREHGDDDWRGSCDSFTARVAR